MWSWLLVRVINLAALFWIHCNRAVCDNGMLCNSELQWSRLEVKSALTALFASSVVRKCRTYWWRYVQMLFICGTWSVTWSVIVRCWSKLTPRFFTRSDVEIVSLNRLSVGCGTTPRRQSGLINDFCLVSAWSIQCRHLTDTAVIYIW